MLIIDLLHLFALLYRILSIFWFLYSCFFILLAIISFNSLLQCFPKALSHPILYTFLLYLVVILLIILPYIFSHIEYFYEIFLYIISSWIFPYLYFLYLFLLLVTHSYLYRLCQSFFQLVSLFFGWMSFLSLSFFLFLQFSPYALHHVFSPTVLDG